MYLHSLEHLLLHLWIQLVMWVVLMHSVWHKHTIAQTHMTLVD